MVEGGQLVEVGFGEQPVVDEEAREAGVDGARRDLHEGREREGHLGEFKAEGRGEGGAASGEAGVDGLDGHGSSIFVRFFFLLLCALACSRELNIEKKIYPSLV